MGDVVHADLEVFGNPIGDWGTWSGLVFSIVAAGVAAVAFFLLRKRERRQALTDLHSSLTSGETAAARHTIGVLLYSPEERPLPSRLEGISAYFALIWALQRARNVFRTQFLPSKELNAPLSRWQKAIPRRRLRDDTAALTWNLTEIAENVVRFHDSFGKPWQVEDADAWKEVSVYVNAERIRSKMKGESDRAQEASRELPAHN